MDEPDSRDPNEIAAEARRIWTRLGVAGAALLVGVVVIALLAGGRPVGPGQGTYDAGTTNPLQAALPLLESYVQSTRELKFTDKIAISVVDDAGLAKQAGRSAVAAKTPAVDRAATLRALGLSAPDGVPIPAGAVYGTDAYYSYSTHTIYLRGGQFDGYHRAVLVHELTLALDDQHFGLLRMTKAAAGSADALRSLDALIDGDATRLELGYVATLPQQEQHAVKATHNYDPTVKTYAENDAAFPAVAGTDFVTALQDQGGNDRVNSAFGNPPTATTQILGPKTYLADQQPYTMREPHNSGTVLDRGNLGQFGLSMAMTKGERYRNVSILGQIKGDAYVTTRAHGKTCVSDAVLLPSEVARDELLRDMVAAGLPAQRDEIDSGLSFQICR